MTKSLKLDYVEDAANKARSDLASLGIPGRKAAKLLGMSNSTLNAFLNAEYNNHHGSTLGKLLAAQIWSAETRQALEILANYEELVFDGKIRLHDAA